MYLCLLIRKRSKISCPSPNTNFCPLGGDAALIENICIRHVSGGFPGERKSWPHPLSSDLLVVKGSWWESHNSRAPVVPQAPRQVL